MIDHDRRLSFGRVADQYERSRPDYPAQLVEDVIAYAPVGPGSAVLEIGAGTGKATRMFCSRGLSVVAVEPDGEMAAVASQKAATAGHNLRIIEADFESAELPHGTFPLAYSAQAWHWVDPETSYRRARRALQSGGVLAAFWNRADWTGHELYAQLQEAYQAAGIPEHRHAPSQQTETRGLQLAENWHPDLARAAGFAELEARRYDRLLEYTSAEYVALLGTYSDHILGPAHTREALLRDIAAVIDGHGGRLRLPVTTLLGLARAD
jgi:SAM-dependent methyltransferase